MHALAPAGMPAPFGRYAHGVLVPAGARWVATSGQLALGPDGAVPQGAEAQAALCLAHMGPYMRARDCWLAGVDRLPASTLVIVSGFTRPEFLVEVEALAARID